MNEGWIPCSERVPAKIDHGIRCCDVYLVTVKVGDEYVVDTAMSWGSYIDDFWDTTNDWIEDKECHVIAWMELPLPYCGG